MSGNPRRREVRAHAVFFSRCQCSAAGCARQQPKQASALWACVSAVAIPVIRGRSRMPRVTAWNGYARARAEALSIRISSISGYYMSEKTSLSHLLANVEAARRVGAPLISQGCFEPDPSRVAELLRDYARAADDAGVRIALEFMPMSSLKTIADAQRVIADSGARNVGLLIDSPHLARSAPAARTCVRSTPDASISRNSVMRPPCGRPKRPCSDVGPHVRGRWGARSERACGSLVAGRGDRVGNASSLPTPRCQEANARDVQRRRPWPSSYRTSAEVVSLARTSGR